MRKELLYIGMVILSLLPAQHTPAQSNPSGSSADITADRQSILIGEPIRLVIIVRTKTSPVVFPAIPDSLTHFDILSRSKIDTVTNKGLFQLAQVIMITSFDSGHWVIPSFDLPGTDIVTDSVPIDVGYIPMKPQDQIRDIKDIIPVHVGIPWWALIFSGVILIVLVVLFIRTLRTRALSKADPLHSALTPYEEAMSALESLKVPVASADVKPFYSTLDGIVKRYLQRTFGWKAMQFTTSDLLLHVQDKLPDAADLSALAEVLRLGDAVKFARYFPDGEWHPRALQQIRKSIDILHKK